MGLRRLSRPRYAGKGEERTSLDLVMPVKRRGGRRPSVLLSSLLLLSKTGEGQEYSSLLLLSS